MSLLISALYAKWGGGEGARALCRRECLGLATLRHLHQQHVAVHDLPRAQGLLSILDSCSVPHKLCSATTLRMQLQPVFHCSSLNALDLGSGR